MTKASKMLKIWTFSVENKYRLIYYNLVIKKWGGGLNNGKQII